MYNICPKCKSSVKEGEEFCSQCGEYLVHKTRRSFSYSIPCFISAGIFAFLLLAGGLMLNLPSLTRYYEPYTIERIRSDLWEDVLISWNIVFGIALGFMLVLAFIMWYKKGLSQKKPSSITKILTVAIPAVIVVSICVPIYTTRKNEDIITVYSREYLEDKFDFCEMHGGDIQFTREFRDELYDYYYEIATAYNQLNKDGDKENFFNAIYSEKHDKLREHIRVLTCKGLYYNSTRYDDSLEEILYTSPRAIESTQIPTKSLECFSLFSSKDYLYVFSHSSEDIERAIDLLNVVFDLFYGQELIEHYFSGTFIKDLSPYFTTIFSHDGQRLTISVIGDDVLNPIENSLIEFSYTGITNEQTIEMSNGKARYSYQYRNSGVKGYLMIHYTKHYVIVNVAEERYESYIKPYIFDDGDWSCE